MGEQRRAVLVVCICSWACLLRCQSVIDRFSEAIRAGRISKVEKIGDCCILAAVGQQMASRKGVAATMFSALAKANINIRCVSLSLTFFSGQ
jgi:aspartokinase